MDERISVIVTTYNQERTIARTLDSILMQQCHLPIEIIIGEDCSTDGTLSICQQYASKHPDIIRLFANTTNKGIIDNYFDCLLKAHGKYIADCAGDDFWTDPLKLEKEANILDQHPEVTLVHTDWLYYNEDDATTRPHVQRHYDKPFTPGTELLEAILIQTKLPIIHLCTSLYRKEAFLKVYQEDTYLFRNKEFGCEDLSLTFMLARQGVIAYLPDVTLNYSFGKDNESISFHKDDKRQFQFVRQISMLIHYLSNRYGIHSATTVNKHMQQRLHALAMHAFRANDAQLRQQVVHLQHEWKVTPLTKTKLILFLTSMPQLWHPALILRKLIVRCRQ
jgi:glycosyltransferase involved in cell wall biosynthesis